MLLMKVFCKNRRPDLGLELWDYVMGKGCVPHKHAPPSSTPAAAASILISTLTPAYINKASAAHAKGDAENIRRQAAALRTEENSVHR
jgi:pentatricopeptide repeat protein